MHIACSAQCARRRREHAEGQDRDTGRGRVQLEAEQQGKQGAPRVAMHRARNNGQGRSTAHGHRETKGAHEGRERQHGKRENEDRGRWACRAWMVSCNLLAMYMLYLHLAKWGRDLKLT